jgi:hypothetical protein
MTILDLNEAKEQRDFDVIPENTVCTLQMTIRPGGAGDGGWLKRSADGASEGLDCELTVRDGPYAKRKLWSRMTLSGTTSGHAEAGEFSCTKLRAIVESARGIRPDDKSETAQAARKIESWEEFNGLCFMARLGVEPPQGKYKAKNIIAEVLTPDRSAWKQPEQSEVKPATSKQREVKPATATPANAIARPQWAS